VNFAWFWRDPRFPIRSIWTGDPIRIVQKELRLIYGPTAATREQIEYEMDEALWQKAFQDKPCE
jgi:hypothetical protein